MTFDPSAAALPGSGIYGLPTSEEDARVVLLPVPWDATTSYGGGAADGPSAILSASKQVDLFDREVGRPYEAGIFLREESPLVRAWNDEARAAAKPVIDAGGAGDDAALRAKLGVVNDLSEKVNKWTYDMTRALLAAGKIVGVVGGDHAAPYGAIRAHAEKHPGMGILHVDAHADLRDAYEGFAFSHASILHNVATRLPQVSKIVQLGIRDFSEDEGKFAWESHGRIVTHFDADWARARLEGATFKSLVDDALAALPNEVYVTFDIDGLDPALCPSTGTPVPGGFSFHEAAYLFAAVVRSGRRIVGFDLNEVAPGPDGDEWDGNVGARLLYKLIGWTLRSRE